MDKVDRIKELVNKLQKAAVAYYKYDNPIMSDKEYDDLYDELELLEKYTRIIMNNSPTQNVQGYILDELQKVKHSKPMLSSAKTKDINEIKKFIGKQKVVMSWKEDGLTIVLRYKNGVFDKAITRGSQGLIGEDVTHTMKMCSDIPMKLPYYTDIEVRGECVISWEDFDRINETLEDPYKHPRNLAAGTVRQLDPSVAKDRNIKFKAFELVQDDLIYSDLDYNQTINIDESFEYLKECGFDVVEHSMVTSSNVDEEIAKYNPEDYDFPVDGLIFKYCDYLYGKSLGETSHHSLDMIALKWSDSLYETTLRDIEWNTSRTGLINPAAIFDEVDLDGADTTRATLHNISYIEDLRLGAGDTIMVYRANMVIPKVHSNLTRSNTFAIPDKCPCCGEPTEIHKDNDSKTLHCTNPYCKARLIARLTHFVSRDAMNIDGLSEATLEKIMSVVDIKSFYDIYTLKDHYDEIVSLDGLGEKSVKKLLAEIEHSKDTELSRFLYALSVPMVGKTACKTISKYFNGDFNKMYSEWINDFDWTQLNDFGNTMHDNMKNFIRHNFLWIKELSDIMSFKTETKAGVGAPLLNKTYVITGTLYKISRKELTERLESLGAKVAGSVSKVTTILINSDTTSNSSKNKKAKELGVSIMNEDEFLESIQKYL